MCQIADIEDFLFDFVRPLNEYKRARRGRKNSCFDFFFSVSLSLPFVSVTLPSVSLSFCLVLSRLSLCLALSRLSLTLFPCMLSPMLSVDPAASQPSIDLAPARPPRRHYTRVYSQIRYCISCCVVCRADVCGQLDHTPACIRFYF